MFGTSGIRGLYGSHINEEMALKIGNIFSDKNVVVGRDIRKTGMSLSNATISGILSSGKDAIDLGIVPTPTLALATKKFGANGIMITASHNPPEYNGLKLFSNELEISKSREKSISIEYSSNKLSYAEWDKLGHFIKYPDAIEDHKILIKSIVNIDLIKSKKVKVVIDSNGPASLITPSILSEVGCEVISINSSLDYFSRPSEPNKENLKELSKKVNKVGADLGIGHDGDADRAVVVDENGEVLPLDIQLAMIVDEELEVNKNVQNKKIITTVEASLLIKNVIEKHNAKMLITPVGSMYIAHLLEEENALFGGEPCGEYVFSNGVHCPDGILTAVKFVELFCKKGPISKLKMKYNHHSLLRDKFKCNNNEKYNLVSKIKNKIKINGVAVISNHSNETGGDNNFRIMDLYDGLRVDEEEGWFLIRASGTEPYIRLTAEYKTEEGLRERVKELREIIREVV